MTKQEVQQRILQDGKPLDLNKFTWDENTQTLSTKENNLVIDFNDISNCTFKTGNNCTFKTGYDCTFKTGSGCTFKTGYDCTFKTSSLCTFKTGSGCTFNTGSDCTFDTGVRCTFRTGPRCTFDTGSDCIFDTGSDCVIVRRDVFKVIQPPKGQTVKLNSGGIKGYTVLKQHTITIDGKEIKLSEESFNELKEQLK